MSDVIQNIVSSCERLGDIELSGVKLESADGDLLNVSWGDLHQHVSMQPAAMAYFGALKKEARRKLDNLLSACDRWEKKKFAEARVVVESGTTAKSSIKVEDVKARFIIDNEPEIEKWESRIGNAQRDFDTLDNWMEAWKQKGFSIHEYVAIDSDERFSGSGSLKAKEVRTQNGGGAEAMSSDKIQRVRDIMRKKRQDRLQVT